MLCNRTKLSRRYHTITSRRSNDHVCASFDDRLLGCAMTRLVIATTTSCCYFLCTSFRPVLWTSILHRGCSICRRCWYILSAFGAKFFVFFPALKPLEKIMVWWSTPKNCTVGIVGTVLPFVIGMVSALGPIAPRRGRRWWWLFCIVLIWMPLQIVIGCSANVPLHS